MTISPKSNIRESDSMSNISIKRSKACYIRLARLRGKIKQAQDVSPNKLPIVFQTQLNAIFSEQPPLPAARLVSKIVRKQAGAIVLNGSRHKTGDGVPPVSPADETIHSYGLFDRLSSLLPSPKTSPLKQQYEKPVLRSSRCTENTNLLNASQSTAATHLVSQNSAGSSSLNITKTSLRSHRCTLTPSAQSESVTIHQTNTAQATRQISSNNIQSSVGVKRKLNDRESPTDHVEHGPVSVSSIVETKPHENTADMDNAFISCSTVKRRRDYAVRVLDVKKGATNTNRSAVEVPFWREVNLSNRGLKRLVHRRRASPTPIIKSHNHSPGSEHAIEDMSNLAFETRHSKFETEEKRRKRWDLQQLRNQQYLNRMRGTLKRREQRFSFSCTPGQPCCDEQLLGQLVQLPPDLSKLERLDVDASFPRFAFGSQPSDFDLSDEQPLSTCRSGASARCNSGRKSLLRYVKTCSQTCYKKSTIPKLL